MILAEYGAVVGIDLAFFPSQTCDGWKERHRQRNLSFSEEAW